MEYHINVPIKPGELVTVIDGSYMLAIDIIENKLTRFPKIEGFDGNISKLEHEYVVIATNVPCPTDEPLTESLGISNNCIIKDIISNTIWFCSKVNLKTIRNLLG